jgi:hypothetical protein
MGIGVADRAEPAAGTGAVWYAAIGTTLIGLMVAAGVVHHDSRAVGWAYLVTLLTVTGWCGFVGARPAGPTLPAALCLVGVEIAAILAADTELAAGDRGDLAGLGLLLIWISTAVLYGLAVVVLVAADLLGARIRKLRRWDGWSWWRPLVWGGLVVAGSAGLSIAAHSADQDLAWIVAAGTGAVSLATGARHGATGRWAAVAGMLITAAVAVAAVVVILSVAGPGGLSIVAPTATLAGLSGYGVLAALFATGACAGGAATWLVRRARGGDRTATPNGIGAPGMNPMI